MLIGAIADDLTGATDLALTLSREGWQVVQTVGVPAPDVDITDADAVVIALKSRTVSVAEAVAQSRAAAHFLLQRGAAQLFFKYCSTFDSTAQGNIGPVIDALLELTGSRGTIACPAYPENGRSVYKGYLFAGDVPLHESSMRNHPLTPMRDSSLVRLLTPQTRHSVTAIVRDRIPVSDAAFGAMLDAVEGIAIVDAIDDGDLRRIGRAAAGLKLVTGGAGVARALPANFQSSVQKTGFDMSGFEGRAIVLAGSCSEATRNQIEIALGAGFPGYRLDPGRVAQGQVMAEDVLDFIRSLPADAIPLVYSSAAPDAVAKARDDLPGIDIGAMVESFFGRLAVLLREAGFARFVVAGGETSGAVTLALDIKSVRIGPEIDPGVPWVMGDDGRSQVVLALKSGNFGSADFFIKAWNAFR